MPFIAGQPDLTVELLRNHVLMRGERFTDLMASLGPLEYFGEASA